MGILESQDLCKTYGSGENEVRALDHVNINIEDGEFISIVGTSGSGKSTLLNMLGGLDRPDTGIVKISGKPIFTMQDEELTGSNAKYAFRRTAAKGCNSKGTCI